MSHVLVSICVISFRIRLYLIHVIYCSKNQCDRTGLCVHPPGLRKAYVHTTHGRFALDQNLCTGRNVLLGDQTSLACIQVELHAILVIRESNIIHAREVMQWYWMMFNLRWETTNKMDNKLGRVFLIRISLSSFSIRE